MDCQKLQNKHQISISTDDRDRVFKEIVLWGEASWWPKKTTMKFIRVGDGPIKEGTIYKQKVLLPFAPSWCSVITKINQGNSVSRRLFDGFIDGEEKIEGVLRGNSVIVEYCLEYYIPSNIHRILWKLCFESMHNYNIEKILKSLKEHLEQ